MTPTQALAALAWAALNYAKAQERYGVEYRRTRDGLTAHQWAEWMAAGHPDERYDAALTAAATAHLAQDAAAATYAKVCGELFATEPVADIALYSVGGLDVFRCR